MFRLEKLAEANKQRVILEAEADAEALRMRGEAEAFAIEARAKAEAEQMSKKADAWKEYREAAMVDMLLDSLPKVKHILKSPFFHSLMFVKILKCNWCAFRLLLRSRRLCRKLRRLPWCRVVAVTLVLPS